MFSEVDWSALFIPETPILEILVRGTITYLMLFFLIRFVFQRESGAVKMTNLLVIVLIADAVQNAMTDDYRSITDGLILAGVILFWAYALDWLGYRIPAIQKWVHPPPLLLIKNGRMLRRNMQEELITKDELMEVLRQQGLEDVKQVQRAWIEGNGRFSVIPCEGQGNSNKGAPQESNRAF